MFTKHILHHLYLGNFNENERSIAQFKNTKEFLDRDNAYKALEKTFTDQQLKLFDEYFLADGGCMGLVLERAYANGFQTGFWLAFELFNFEV